MTSPHRLDKPLPPLTSIYPFSPVFSCRIADRPAVIKRTRRKPADATAVAATTREWQAGGVAVVTPLELRVANPVLLGNVHWVAYPFVKGRTYTGQIPEIAAAGTLLARIHAIGVMQARLPAFRWPDYDKTRVDADVELLRTVVAPHASGRVVERLVTLVTRFTTDVLPSIRWSSAGRSRQRRFRSAAS